MRLEVLTAMSAKNTSRMSHYVVWGKFIDISEQSPESVFRVEGFMLVTTRLHSVASYETVFLNRCRRSQRLTWK
jgi:hypothetical protein